MPLVRMGGSAFDLARVAAVVRREGWWPGTKWEDRVTVFLSDSTSVELSGDDARAFLRYVASLPPHDEGLGPLGSRIAGGGGGVGPDSGQQPRREAGG